MDILSMINTILVDALIVVLAATLVAQLRDKSPSNWYRLLFLVILLLL